MTRHNHQVREPIAVVGIGCRFPGDIATKEELWEALRQGTCVVSDVPVDRFDVDAYHDSDPRKYGAVRSRRGGFLDNIYSFDADFFGLFPAEASRIDPQQRLTLEAAVHAFEDSGTPLENVAGSRTSVFVGTFMCDHVSMQSTAEQRDNIGSQTAMGVSTTSIANRVSHRLNLQGPSITLDTACSSSLVALHLACQSIWTGESEAALAGGVNAILRPESTMFLSKAGFLSPDGACKSFDAAANGYVRSEGVGMVYLKPMSRALEDKDRIYALVRASLVNSDGYTPEGYTVPSLKAQTALLQSVYSQAGVDPAMVRYVEAHGPGTPVGDPIEANALGRHFGQARPIDHGPLWISSIKGNVGHLEGASGISGFIKAALVTFHGIVPPQANHKIPNPAIDFKNLRLSVPTHGVNLKEHWNHRLFVGVNSFGAGGTNAHAVLEEAPAINTHLTSRHDPRVFVLSARSLSAVEKMAMGLSSWIRKQRPKLPDVAHTLISRRSLHRHISIITAQGIDDLCSQLGQLGSGQASKNIPSLQRTFDVAGVAFVFSGQGGQWIGMGMALLEQEPVFRESLEAFDRIFMTVSGRSIIRDISNFSSPARLNSTTVVQPAIAAIQIALARTLISCGLKPKAIVGHSIGEVAAAHIAGAISLDQAVKIIYLRSAVQSKAVGSGSMLAAGLSSDEADRLISRLQLAEKVEVATLNGPKMTTMAGDSSSLQLIAQELDRQGVFARAVNVEVPYHSRFMDPLETELLDTLAPFRGAPTHVDLYSTVTTSIEPGTHLTGQYWFENIRKPVRYVETAKRMMDDGLNCFIEIGPHPVLVSSTRSIAETVGRKVQVLPAMTRGQDLGPFAALIGSAFALGVDVDIDSFNGGGGKFIDLPLYPFQRQHYSFEHPKAQRRRLGTARHPFYDDLVGLTEDNRGIVRLRLSTGVSPFLTDHVADGTILFPATGHIEAAYLAAKKFLPNVDVWLEDIRFEHPVVLAPAEDFAPEVLLEITSPAKDYVISSRPAAASPQAAWQVCSRGRINAFDQFPDLQAESLQSLKDRIQAGTQFNMEEFYSTLEGSGLRYGEAFQGIKELWDLGGEIFASVKLPEIVQDEACHFRFHPALLDACLHAVFAHIHHRGDPRYVYLPYHADKVLVHDSNGATDAFVHIRIKKHDDTVVIFDAYIYNTSGQILAAVLDLTNKRLLGQQTARPTEYEINFQLQPQSESTRVEAEFSTVLLLDSEFTSLSEITRRTFPSARVVQKSFDAKNGFSGTTEPDYALDRRTLIVFPALTQNCMEKMRSVVASLLGLARWMHDEQSTATIMIVTRGCCMTELDADCSPLSASIEAAARVVANEFPQCRIRVIDLPMDQHDWQSGLLGEELRFRDLSRHDTVVALRSGKRFIRRIVAVNGHEAEKSACKEIPARGGNYFCEPDGSGNLEGIVFRQQTPHDLGPDDVAIEVHATGLNFKDVMNTMGLLTERAVGGALAGQNLGLEIAGKVVDVGPNVQDLEIGTAVLARVLKGLGGFVTANRSLVMPIPTSLSSAQAACVPVVYVTAYYALVYLGRLTAGDSVIIHSAAGGVGLAAMQIAKLYGARIFATAGSPERREWALRNGADAVFYSHSLSFHDEVMAATQGEGVDIVLNCLTGSLLSQSIACLATFGRFLEIGKTDVYRNMKLGLEQFGENRSFFVIDIDRMAAQKPSLHRRMLGEVCKLFENGKLMPPRITEYPITKLPSALRDLSKSAVIGKVAMTMPKDVQIEAAPPTQLQLRPDRTYLVTGGASGLGVHLAWFLAERGAKHLVLMSRSGPKTAEDQAVLLDIKNQGVTVRLEQADVADPDAVASVICSKDRPPVAGVVHSAAVLRDLYSYDTTIDDYWTVFRPKALGALNLHLATRDMDLDFFVLTSSMSSVLGSAGQLSYVSANQFLDSLAQRRQRHDLPGLSLNFGILGTYAGMSRRSAQNDRIRDIWGSQGFRDISLSAVFSAFERAILQGVPQRMPINADWSMFLTAYPHLLRDSAFMNLANDATSDSASTSKGSLSSLTGQELVTAIAEKLQSGLAKIVGLEPNRISLTEKIDQYAFDSLTMTQFRGLILREFRVTFAVMKLFQGPSLQEIATEVAGSFSKETQGLQRSGNAGNRTDASSESTATALPVKLHAVSKWLVKGKPVSNSLPKLVCFHCMGAGASLFAQFLIDPPDGFEPIAIQLPGRENRSAEAIYTRISELVDDILEELESHVGPRDVFWGHSFGGIVAFEVLKALRRKGKPLPRLMVAGTIAPHLISHWQRRDALLQVLTDDPNLEYMLATHSYVEDVDLVRSILPGMKKDVPLLLGYRYNETEAPLDVPVTAFASRQDEIVYPDEVGAWREHAKDFKLIEVDGDHWFLNRNRKLLRETLASMAQGKI